MLALCLILAIRICLDYTKQMIKKTDTANHGISGEVRRAVVYARVSSKEQEREGFSIPAQLKSLRDYAATAGFRIAQEYVDVETAKQARIGQIAPQIEPFAAPIDG